MVYENGQAFVYAGGEKIATSYEVGTPSPALVTMWHHKDPNMSSYRSTEPGGTVLGTGVDNHDWDKIETDGDGKSVGLSAPLSFPEHSNELYTSGWSFGSLNTGQYMVHVVDGIHVPAEFMWNRIDPRLGLAFDLLFSSIIPTGHDDPEYYVDWDRLRSISAALRLQQKQTRKPAVEPDRAHLADAIDQCARLLFGVKLTGGSWSDQTNPGYLNFEVLDGGTVDSIDSNGQRSQVSTFSIGNNTSTYTSTDLIDSNTGEGAAGFSPARLTSSGDTITGIYSWESTIYGKRLLFQSNTTFTVSDRVSNPNIISDGQRLDGRGLGISGMIHTQIHEAGNALATITGRLLNARASGGYH
ncbi:MAG TPA: hypothetical protein PKD24_14505 [Pyrinomonadaceae bacterium]|nr:hypothetical protein [Pyrinomonadaceae bacterium]HMP66585.1 hypothetical protein [Pyrinomonadaceae bacterium]